MNKIKDLEINPYDIAKDYIKDGDRIGPDIFYGRDFTNMLVEDCINGVVPESYRSYKFRPEMTYRLLEFEGETNLIKESIAYSKDGWQLDVILGKHTIILRRKKLVKEDRTVISLEHFINICKHGELIDSDGFGYYFENVHYASQTISNEYVWPSDILGGRILQYPSVIWYNYI